MKKSFAVLSLLLCTSVQAAPASQTLPSVQGYASCTTTAQAANQIKADGPTNDALHNHILARVRALKHDISAANQQYATISSTAQTLLRRVDAVNASAARDVKAQGFLSAAERASYDRELNAVAASFCNALHSR